MNEHATPMSVPVDPEKGVSLVQIYPGNWHRFVWPEYQRHPNMNRVKVIAKGIREGYDPGPITIYEQGEQLLIVDGGHRVKAYMQNLNHHGLTDPVLAILYRAGAIDQNMTFVLENSKMRMNPSHIIRADNKSRTCKLIRSLGQPDSLFGGFGDVELYPIRPLTLIKAGILLTKRGDELAVNEQAYLSVARAIKAFDEIHEKDKSVIAWTNLVKLIYYMLDLWGYQGRHLLNFGVLGFAYFLSKNASRFFGKNGILEIKSKRLSVSEKRRAREFHDSVNSDFAKLQALKDRWEKPGDPLRIEASRDPVQIAMQINTHFWKNKPVSQRIWRPELSW